MKEGLVETAAFILAKRFGALEEEVSEKLLSCFEIDQFQSQGTVKEVARAAREDQELGKRDVFSRILRFMHYCMQQFWEEHQKSILATARLKTYLLKRSSTALFKNKILEIEGRVNLEKVWKPQGTTFLDSLPDSEE